MKPPTMPRPAFGIPSDPSVEDILRESQRKQAEAGLSQEERRLLIERRQREQRRKEKARRKALEQLPNRINLMLPRDLKGRMEKIAGWIHVPVSQVVTFLLYEAVKQMEQGQIDLSQFRVPSESPRYDYNLIHPLDTERQSKLAGEKRKSGWGGGK